MKKLILKHWSCSFYESDLLLPLVGPHCFAAEKSAIALYFGAAPAILHSVDVEEQSADCRQCSARAELLCFSWFCRKTNVDSTLALR